jgi:hypothetical protein
LAEEAIEFVEIIALLPNEQVLSAPSPCGRGDRSSVFEIIVTHLGEEAIELVEIIALLPNE